METSTTLKTGFTKRMMKILITWEPGEFQVDLTMEEILYIDWLGRYRTYLNIVISVWYINKSNVQSTTIDTPSLQ